jgi:hypothetical protein
MSTSGPLGRGSGGRRANWCMGFWQARRIRGPAQQPAARGEASKGSRRCRQMDAKHADGTGGQPHWRGSPGCGAAVAAVNNHAGPRPICVFCVHLPASALSLACCAAYRTVAARGEARCGVGLGDVPHGGRMTGVGRRLSSGLCGVRPRRKHQPRRASLVEARLTVPMVFSSRGSSAASGFGRTARETTSIVPQWVGPAASAAVFSQHGGNAESTEAVCGLGGCGGTPPPCSPCSPRFLRAEALQGCDRPGPGGTTLMPAGCIGAAAGGSGGQLFMLRSMGRRAPARKVRAGGGAPDQCSDKPVTHASSVPGRSGAATARARPSRSRPNTGSTRPITT